MTAAGQRIDACDERVMARLHYQEQRMGTWKATAMVWGFEWSRGKVYT